MNIIGISAFYHDSACCLLKDGLLVAAAEEERFTRRKHDSSLPVNAFNYCLTEGNIPFSAVDIIAYYEDPFKKQSRQTWSGRCDDTGSLYGPENIEFAIREQLGFTGTFRYFDHHYSHAASSFYFSGFKEAAIMTVDGVGEWATTTYGSGRDGIVRLFEEVGFPDSLGLLYSTLTSYLGFKVNSGEYKVMGLAPYGEPVYLKKIMQLINLKEAGQYSLNMQYFDYIKGDEMYSAALSELFERAPRKKDQPVEKFHMDIARSLQLALENILLEKVDYLHRQTGMDNLCMAGGVALNCVANGKIIRQGPFKKLFVQPAANDAGGALGAAALANAAYAQGTFPLTQMKHAYLGPEYADAAIQQVLDDANINYTFFKDIDQLIEITADKLSKGMVIGWFQGRMEFGPRSLGNRAILADPRREDMRDKINSLVKKREAFRPFAPVVIEDKAHLYFDMDHPSPFMLETCDVNGSVTLPAITHIDSSARVQTVNPGTNQRLSKLLDAFENITGIPILLNTSFNINKEPIVCSPEDAVKCFVLANLNCLVIGNYLVEESQNNLDKLRFTLDADRNFLEDEHLQHNLYSFI